MKHYTDKEINDKLDRLEQEREKMVFVSNAWIEASLKRCREIDRLERETEQMRQNMRIIEKHSADVKRSHDEVLSYVSGQYGYLHFVKK